MKHMKTKKASRTILACLLACLLTGTALLSGCSKDSAGAASGNTSAESQSNTTESGTESGQTVSGTGDPASSGAADTSQSGTTDSSSKTQGGINTKPVESSNSTKPFTKPKYDLKGRELIVWGVTQPKKGTIEYESWKEVEAEYNCKLKFNKVSYSVAVNKQTAAALSGTSECDIWCTQWYDTFPSFVAKGMVAPLSQYYDFDADPNWDVWRQCQ